MNEPEPLEFAWFYSPRDQTNVVSLCRGHAYLATEGRFPYRPGKGAFEDLPDADKCCVCMGTAYEKRFRGKPKRHALDT